MNLNPDYLHHAYILFGNINESVKQLREFFDTSITNMQWLEYRYEKLGVDEVRELREVVSQKTDGRFLIITAERFPTEAQQALLKMLEEPADNTHLFIIVPSQVFVLETVLSRAIAIRSKVTTTDQLLSIRQFLLGSVSQRLDTLESLVKSREKDQSLQSYEVQQFLDQVESALYALFSKKRSVQFTESFQAIRDARGWAGQTGFPMKNIIEYVAMVLPEFGKK